MITELCIKRPVLAIVINLMIIVAGWMGYHYLTTRYFPKFESETLYVSTVFPGASAKLVESSVTTPIEESITGIAGIDYMNSTSSEGSSMVTLSVKPGVDINVIANKVRNKISMNSYKLPSSIRPPSVVSGWGNMDLLDVGITSTTMTLQELRDYVERYIINRIEQLPNIADVEISGANKYAMRIEVNPKKLRAHNLDINDVTTTISQNNIQLPAGQIKEHSIEYPITAMTKLKSADEFADIALTNKDGHITRLKDVAEVKLGADNAKSDIVRINGLRGINMTVFNTTNGNPIIAAKDTLKLLNEIKSQLPAGMSFNVTFNQAQFMQTSIHEVYQTIAIAILCVIAVIYLFLGKLRSVFIPIVTIPVCIIASFGLIYLFGYTINIITLLAIVLSIGLIVDDAIVMLENIYRHIEMGKPRMQAALVGSKEMLFPIIAMTLTLAAVYAPIGFVKGVSTHIFGSFAYTLAGAVMISGVVALTLSPMMCARILPQQINHTGYSKFLYNFVDRLRGMYQSALGHILKLRLSIVIITLAIAGSGYFIAHSMPKGFMPAEDMGYVMIRFKVPAGSSLASNEQQQKELYTLLKQIPDIKDVTQFVSQSDSYNASFVTLKPFKRRNHSAKQIAAQINQAIKQAPNISATAFPPSYGGDIRYQLSFYIIASSSYYDLYRHVQKAISSLQTYPGILSIDTDLKFDSQQYAMTIKRQLASQLQVDAQHIDSAVANFLGGTTISSFDMDGRNYDVNVQATDPYLHSLNAIDQFYIKNTDGKLISLGQLVDLKPSLEQRSLSHYNRLRAALNTVTLRTGYSLDKVVMYLQQHLPGLLPSNAQYAFSGLAKKIGDSSNNIAIMFILGIVFIYLVLAAQFESFLDPLVILLAVPLSIVSALLALQCAHASLDIYSMIGLMTLIGLIAKHGILITQFANQLQRQGNSITDAIIEAAGIRLRPILMTTAAMICGALPLLFSSGASSQSRFEIGIVIVTGLLFGTFFSLIVVPVLYTLVNQLRQCCSKIAPNTV